jgi:FecR protein
MTSPRYADLAARVLAGEGRRGKPAPPPLSADRTRAIFAIERAIAERARRRRRQQWIVTLSAAAAVMLAGAGAAKLAAPFVRGSAGASSVAMSAPPPVWTAPVPSSTDAVTGEVSGEGASMVVNGAPTALQAGRAIPLGARVVARPMGRAILAFATGTNLLVEEGGDMTILEEGASQTFLLGGGSMRADVVKLDPNQRFVVRTRDAEVEAHGTEFRVSIVPGDPACGDGTTTRVAVMNGTVVVRHTGAETTVGAGKSWPSGCASASVNMAPVVVTRAPSATVSSPSTLADENDMYASAIAAKNRGATGAALSGFDALLAKYPSGPHTESAMAEKMRLLRGTDAGRAAATQYLARFPNGFARREAAAMLVEER